MKILKTLILSTHLIFIVILSLLILSFYYNLKIYLIKLGHKRLNEKTVRGRNENKDKNEKKDGEL